MTPQELKNSILQLAIQGKLVEPNIRDFPVDLSAIKQKKTDDYEFELPDNWRLAHLESITKNIPSKQYQILESQVLADGRFPVISQSKAYSIGFSNEADRVYHHDRPVIIFGDHTTEVKFVEFDFVVGADGVKIFEPIDDIIVGKFLFYIFQFYSRDLSKIGGYSRHYKYIKNKPFPLPPLAEQKRIVAKIEELLPHIDRYEHAWSKLEQFNSRFPEDMKKSLLQYAIQGKLVEQRPEEGTAEELFAQIQEEKQRLIAEKKIKKEKPLPEITEEKKPFDIPESWKWVYLLDIIEEKPSNGYSPKGVTYPTEIKNLTLTATTSGRFKDDAFKYVDISKEDASKYWLKNNDLLIQRSNSRELVGTSCIYTGADNAYIYPDLMMRMHVSSQVDIYYIDYVLKAPVTRNYYMASASGTSESMPKINQKIVSFTLVPLPPLAEQKRIVEKLEQLLPLCERLK
ncbi:MAG TPA: restriction endonuclease subunit S [Candidatus Blautia merdipullorum]|nr:restriction endonuclease subunit S [Candidatus Lachnoclostridium avicola]HJB33891.1 restriction endonuclease subunit S [Candidatus Blautia merdipullorum]